MGVGLGLQASWFDYLRVKSRLSIVLLRCVSCRVEIKKINLERLECAEARIVRPDINGCYLEAAIRI
jgi:hypothetical protein